MKRIVLLISTFLLVFGGTNEKLAATILPPILPSITTSYELLSRPAKGGNIRIKLNFHWRNSTEKAICHEGTATVCSVHNLVYNGPKKFNIVIGNNIDNYSYLDVTLPPDDTSAFMISVEGCDKGVGIAAIWFVTTGDSLETYNHRPQILGIGQFPPSPKPKLDTNKYDFIFDLRDSSKFKFLKQHEDVLGPIKPTSTPGFYIIHTTKQMAKKLKEAEGIKSKLVTKESDIINFPIDSIFNEKSTSDTNKPQGLLNNKLQPNGLGSIYLDHVDGMTTPWMLPTNQPITFYLQVNNATNYNFLGITNGFRIYSPDGARWGGTTADTLNLGWEDMFDFWFQIKQFSADGVGADTVGYLGVSSTGSGIPPYFDELSFKITIGPIDDQYIGKTICLDSSFFGGGGYWEWTTNGYDIYYPLWGGPDYFTIRGDSIAYSGHLYYLDPVPPDTNQKPMRNVKIEMWDYDVFSHDDFLDSTTTDDNGYFSLGPVDNSSDESGTLDIFFRIYAENEASYVTKGYNGDKYRIQTPTVDNLPSGFYDTTIVAPLDSSGAFFVADAVLDGYRKWCDLTNTIPDQVHVDLWPDTISYFDYNSNIIHIGNYDYAPAMTPDDFDASIILHEYGHFLEFSYHFFDDTTNKETESASWYSSQTPSGITECEAWAQFWPSVVQNNQMFINRALDNNGNLSFYEYFNVENGCTGVVGLSDSSCRTANNFGKNCIASVTGIFWDIYDNNNDDYSTYNQYVGCGANPDGIGDTLSDGIYNILDVLLNRNVNGHHPDNIDEFWQAWLAEPSLDHVQAMHDIWYEHGVQMSCCVGMSGNIDGDPDDNVNMSDIMYFANWLLGGGPEPPCREEAEVNGDGSVNVSDVIYLANYAFGGGPAPIACQ